jgi:hypothetical protein
MRTFLLACVALLTAAVAVCVPGLAAADENIIANITSAGTAHTNSTDEAVLSSQELKGNHFRSGKVYRYQGAVRATATNATDTLTVVGRVGTAALSGTAVFSSGAIDVANNDLIVWDVLIIPRSAAGSTSGSLIVTGSATILGAEGTVTSRAVHEIVSSVDYTASQYVSVTGDWSVANAGNSAQAEAFVLTELF